MMESSAWWRVICGEDSRKFERALGAAESLCGHQNSQSFSWNLMKYNLLDLSQSLMLNKLLAIISCKLGQIPEALPLLGTSRYLGRKEQNLVSNE
jgi:hypothetical protein